MKGRIALAAFMALTFVGASWQLNPLVTRTAQPTGPVPAGCDESLAPAQTPRVIVADIPEREVLVPVSMPAPPPSRSLREELDAAHRALVRNDRPAFDEHLRAARSIVETYPAGGERSRAEEVVWALNDASVLWDAQFASPFFDETSDAYTRASRYAGYTDAMRRSVLTDDQDRRFYPAAESREFVSRVAAERLERLGVRSSMPPPRTVRAETPRRRTAPSVSVASASSTSSSSPSPSPSRHRTTTRSHSSRKSSPTHKTSKPAALAKSAPSSSPDPSAAAPSPAPAEPAPTAPPASAPTSSATDSASAPASPVAEDVAPTPIVTDSATTTVAPASPEPAPSTSAAPAERRSVIVPALLILIGLGVLIVLFRASK